jgi:cell wall assembly regulator SMI1
MPPSVDASWDVILRWLELYAPAVAAEVRPPAPEADIQAAAEMVGRDLPDDLVALWRRADGLPGVWLLPPFFALYPIEQALESLRIMRRIQAHYGTDPDYAEEYAETAAAPAGTAGSQWLPQWLPIAGGGYELFVDLRPGPAYGCLIAYDSEGGAGTPLWPGVAAMLADLAGGIQSDRWVQGWRIWGTEDGRIEWDERGRGGWWNGDPARLHAAYTELLDEARAGGFGSAPNGWTAEQILAHVARTDDLLIAVGEAVLPEEPPGPQPGAWTIPEFVELIAGDADRRAVAARAGAAHGLGDITEWPADRVLPIIEQNVDLRIAFDGARYAIDDARRERLAERAASTSARIRYDNHDAMDPTALAEHASRHGGLAGLADRVGQTSARLAELALRLRDNHTVVGTRIRQAGGELSTDPAPWTSLISHHVMRHLPRHTRQLRALRGLRPDGSGV